MVMFALCFVNSTRAQRNFMTEHNLPIRESELASEHDFNPVPQPPAGPVDSPRPASPQPIYDMIVVQQPPKIVGYESNMADTSNEKATFKEAINGPDKVKWIEAMKDEMRNIHQNETT